MRHEIARDNHSKGEEPRAVLKIDIMKAYDSLSWDFLFNVMKMMNFPERYIGRTKNCVTTAQFSINLNGLLVDYFPSEKGLRQGDPIAPYLFILAMEMFSMLFDWNIKGFDYHPKCRDLKLNHIKFPVDLFFITATTSQSFEIIKDTIEEFGK